MQGTLGTSVNDSREGVGEEAAATSLIVILLFQNTVLTHPRANMHSIEMVVREGEGMLGTIAEVLQLE